MKVAICGTNCLAYWLACHLAGHGNTHQFIILSRAPKYTWSQYGWNVVVVNYNNEQDLVIQLTGCDLVISMISGNQQLLLIDAALAAHVRRFVPCEFAGQPAKRPEALNRGHRGALSRLHQHVEEGMQHTVFVFGIFYDTFGPGGLHASNMGRVSTGGHNGEGSFLMDVRARRAQIPLNQHGTPARVCMISIVDAARYIVGAIVQKPLHTWRREYCVRGERLDVRAVVRVAENLRGATFERPEYSREALQSRRQLAHAQGNAAEVLKMNRMMAVGAGAYDFAETNLNVGVTPYRFEDWLRDVWQGSL